MFERIKRFFGKSNKIGTGLTVNLKDMINHPLSKDSGFIYRDGKGSLKMRSIAIPMVISPTNVPNKFKDTANDKPSFIFKTDDKELENFVNKKMQ